MSASVLVRSPATSANLGPVFDSAGLCLSLYDEVEVELCAGGRLELAVEGEGGAALSRLGPRHLVVDTLRRTLALLGQPRPGLRVRCRNAVPHSRGLGSSSAAIVAGVLAARALVNGGAERLDDAGVLRLADELEGHPDNVAACLRGGFTLARRDDDGLHVVRRDVHPDVVPVVLVPAERSSTREVRGLLPPLVPHVDAAANAARAALLALALTADPGLLLAATQDRLHQPYRAPAMPRTAALVAQLRAEGVAAVVSGAGPSVLVLTVGEQTDAVVRLPRDCWAAQVLPVAPAGAHVVL